MVTIKESVVKKGFSYNPNKKGWGKKFIYRGVDSFKIKENGLSSITNRDINIQGLEILEEFWYHLQPVLHTFCLKGILLIARNTAQQMKFSIAVLFSKCDQNCSFNTRFDPIFKNNIRSFQFFFNSVFSFINTTAKGKSVKFLENIKFLQNVFTCVIMSQKNNLMDFWNLS